MIQEIKINNKKLDEIKITITNRKLNSNQNVGKEIKSTCLGTPTTPLSWCGLDQLTHQIQNFTPFSQVHFWESKQGINLQTPGPEHQKNNPISPKTISASV